MTRYNKIKVYLSGGMRTNWQGKVMQSCGDKFVFFNPYEHNIDKSIEYTQWDIFHVKESDILFAYIEKSNPSGIGLALEIGYAKALSKLIILVDEKSGQYDDFRKYFNIVRDSASVVFDNLDDGIKYLKKYH